MISNASVLGLLNVAKFDDDIDQKNRYMGMMEESVKKLDGFIQDIINYSRNSRLAIEKVSFDLKALIEDLLTLSRIEQQEHILINNKVNIKKIIEDVVVLISKRIKKKKISDFKNSKI